MKLEMKISVKQIILAVIGIVLLGFGIGWNVKIGIGGDSLSTLYTALSKLSGLSVGTITALINLFFIAITFILYKKNLGIATVMFMLISKFPIDFATNYFIGSDNFIVSIILCILSIACIALGSEFFIISDLGADSYTAFTMAIGKKLKHEVKYVYIRWFFDGTILILAYLLGGNVGIGTILSFAFVGSFMKMFQGLLEKYLK